MYRCKTVTFKTNFMSTTSEEAPGTTCLSDELSSYYLPPESFQRRYRTFVDQYLLVYNLALLLMSVFSLVLSVLSTVLWLSDTEISKTVARGLNFFNAIISVLSVCIVIAIYNLEFSIFRFCTLYKGPWRKFLGHDKNYVGLIFKIAAFCIFPYPYAEKWSHFWSVAVIFRMYPIQSVLQLTSDIYRMRHKIDIHMRFHNKDLPKYDAPLILRVMLNTQGFKAFGCFSVALYVIMCYFAYAAMRYSSLSYPLESSSDFSLATSLYWALQTTTTLGYGEIALNHQDWYVLLIAMLVAFVGLVNNSVLTGLFAMELSPQGSEERAIEMSQGLKLLETLKQKSLELLQLEFAMKVRAKRSADVEKMNEIGEGKWDEKRMKRKAKRLLDDIYHIRWELNDVFQNFKNMNISKEISNTLKEWESRSAAYRGSEVNAQGDQGGTEGDRGGRFLGQKQKKQGHRPSIRQMCELYTKVLILCHMFGVRTRTGEKGAIQNIFEHQEWNPDGDGDTANEEDERV